MHYLHSWDVVDLIGGIGTCSSNRVYIDESEALLKSVSLDEELVVLYRTKGLHRKALSLLMTRLEVRGAVPTAAVAMAAAFHCSLLFCRNVRTLAAMKPCIA